MGALAPAPGIKAVIADYDWTRYKRFVDIAGAYGSFLARLMRHVPRAEGVLFDQPQVHSSRLRKLAPICIQITKSKAPCLRQQSR